MTDETDSEELRARIDEAVNKRKGYFRWLAVGGSVIFFVYMIVMALGTTDPKWNPAYMVVAPAIGWMLTIGLQALSAALGSGDASDTEDEARARLVRRLRRIAFGLALVIWTVAALIDFLQWSQNIPVPFVWFPILVWGISILFGFGVSLFYDQGKADRALRRRVLKTIIDDERLEQLYKAIIEKPKQKRRSQAPIIGDDGEMIDTDSAEQDATAHKR